MAPATDHAKLLSTFVAELQYSHLSAQTVQTARRFLLDYFAAAIAGYRMNKTFNRAVEAFLLDEGSSARCSALFASRKLSCSSAAFLNACYAHGADMDDGNRKAMGHVGAHVISAVLAMGERLGSTQQDMLVAIVAGYDVYCRTAAADESKFSIHYALAAMLVAGKFTLEELEADTIDPAVREMTGKIRLICDPTMENRDAGIRGCRVELKTSQGCFSRTVLIPKGDPENPYTVEDLKNKLSQCAGGLLDTAAQEKLMQVILTFGSDRVYDPTELFPAQ